MSSAIQSIPVDLCIILFLIPCMHTYICISMEMSVFGSPLPCHLSDGTTCPPLLYPNTSIILTCTLPPMATLLGFTIWKLPNGTCGSRPSSGSPQDTITLYQEGLTNCANTMPDTCGGFRGQIGLTCRSSTLSVTVTHETNGSDVKCYSTNYSAFELLGSANIQLMPASKPSIVGGGGGVRKQSKVILNSILCVPLYEDLNRNVCHNTDANIVIISTLL